MNGGHEEHAGDDDDAEENERQGDRNGEDQHQKYVSSTGIGTDNPNAVLVDIHARPDELFAFSEPL